MHEEYQDLSKLSQAPRCLGLIFLSVTFWVRALVQSEKMGVKVIFQSWNSTNLPRMAGPYAV